MGAWQGHPRQRKVLGAEGQLTGTENKGLTDAAVLIKCPKFLVLPLVGGRLANVNDKKYILMARDVAATVGHSHLKQVWAATTVCLYLGCDG